MKLTDPNAKYAIPPEGVFDHLTPGKEYLITWREIDSMNSFRIYNDNGQLSFCLEKGCAHINRQDWIFSS